MKKLLCMLGLLLTLAASAHAYEMNTYTYGGSGRDWLYHMAVSDNGFIALTGWTESADGTLANRTKKGRSGWLLVIDQQGKEIVNFCTRLGNHDNLEQPVFHEDGTLTVILFAEDASVGWTKHELIRMDMSGEVLSRRVIAEKGEKDEHFISVIAHDERGYILREISYGEDGYCHYELYDYDGNHVRRLDEWADVYAAADAHVIRPKMPDGKEMWLYKRDENGEEIPQCSVFARREDQKWALMVDGFLSLPDGGAAMAGWILKENEAGEARVGLFTRWDAQGRLVSEMHTPDWGYGEMALRSGGFAATVYPWDETWANDSVWMIHLLDQNGVLQEAIELTSDAVGTGHDACIGALGDGAVIAACVLPQNGQDAAVTIITP